MRVHAALRIAVLLAALLGAIGCDEPAAELDAGPGAGDAATDAGSADAGPLGDLDAGPLPDGGWQPDAGVDGGAVSGSPVWLGVGNWGFRASTRDGVTYTTTQNAETGSDHSPDLLRDVSYGDGAFIAVGGDRNSMIMRSTDGLTWAEDLQPSGTQWLGGVAYGDGLWVAVGGVGTNHRSSDGGLTWTQNDARLPSAGRNIAYADGLFVAIGDAGMIASSSDGVSWADHSLGGEISLGVIERVAGLWVAAGSRWNGSGFDSRCATSADAITWSDCPFGQVRVETVAQIGGALLLGVDGGHERWDGAWTRSEVPLPARLFEADGMLVGVSGARRYHGSSIEALTQIDDSERGFRSFTLGFVE